MPFNLAYVQVRGYNVSRRAIAAAGSHSRCRRAEENRFHDQSFPAQPGSRRRPATRGLGRGGPIGLPTPPKGWPIGSYPTYAEAQRAVDYLSDQQFPVQQVTIVGVDLMQVERVTGRLTWPKVLGGGVLTGAWLGIFIGLVLGIFGQPQWSGAARPVWWPASSSA